MAVGSNSGAGGPRGGAEVAVGSDVGVDTEADGGGVVVVRPPSDEEDEDPDPESGPIDVAAMAENGTVAVLLPAAFYFLREQRPPPVDAFRRAGVDMAIASDMNPGSSPVASLLIGLHMGCTLFGLTVEEALLGVTRNAGKAMGAAATAGVIGVGRPADFTTWDLPSPGHLVYQLGGLAPEAVYVGGVRL